MARQTRQPVAARVERRLETVARRMVEAFTEEIPVYRQLPGEQLDGEILMISRHNLRLFFRCLREGRSPTDEELDEPRASAARRAEESVALDAILAAYHVGARVGWEAMVQEVRSKEDHDELPVLGARVIGYLQAVTGAVAAAYVDEQQHVSGEERDARRRAAELLLSPATGPLATPRAAAPGEASTDADAQPLASRAGVRLAPGYVVLALRFGPSGDERDTQVVPAVAGRRKVRRVQTALDQQAGEPVLSLLDPSGGSVLFPLSHAEPEEAVRTAALVTDTVAKAANAEVLAGAAWRSGPSGATEAAAEAGEVLRLADALDRPPGFHTLDDVLLEYTWTASPRTARKLAGALEPLAARPELIETLEAWFAADFDRRKAATALTVHPNTLDYRLRRIHELTGLSVSTARGIQVLGAALTVRRLLGTTLLERRSAGSGP